jgi:hypothetical protein
MFETNNLGPVKSRSIESFDLDNIFEFCEEFDRESHILEAIAELIRTADLSCFVGSGSGELQWGLQQLLSLYGEHQANRVDKLYDEALNSPDYILERAKTICEGELADHCTDVLQTLQRLDLLLASLEDGDKKYEQAIELRGRLLAIANTKK